MNRFDPYLSSIIRNKEKVVGTQNPGTDDNSIIESIRQFKHDVVSGHSNPAFVNLVQPEIVESWMRCKSYGLKMDGRPICPILDQPELEKLQLEKNFLINATESILREYEPFLADNYDVHLSDENGVNLLVSIGKNDTRAREEFDLVPGAVWSEETMGTASFTLCQRLKRPMQVSCSEHYFDAIGLITGCSAPIFDLDYNLAGVITVGSMYYNLIGSQTLSLAISIAGLIQKEYQLALYEELYKTIREATDEVLITVDNKGMITYANKGASNIFGYLDCELTGQSIELIFPNHHDIVRRVMSGQSVDESEIFINDQAPYLYSCQPVKNLKGNIFGFVIVFKKKAIAAKTVKPVKNPDTRFTFDDIIGTSPPMAKAIAMARKFAVLNSNMLLQGESGTGKDVMAQAIHNESRPGGPFVAVNCAAIPRTLIESELFGYEGGAFTGASRNGRPGKIEQAHGGTLFLDEIGDMPLELQPVLLRVLEEKRVVRVGGNRSIPVDFKLVAATNRDVVELVNHNQFREDLYYRLAVFKIFIPPLRARGLDLIALIRHFISFVVSRQGIPEPTLSNAAKYCLLQYNWPGNVRQLENTITFAVNMAGNGIIKPEDLPEEMQAFTGAVDAGSAIAADPIVKKKNEGPALVDEKEKTAILQALHQSGYNISGAAKLLGMSRSTLYRKIKKYNI